MDEMLRGLHMYNQSPDNSDLENFVFDAILPAIRCASDTIEVVSKPKLWCGADGAWTSAEHPYQN